MNEPLLQLDWRQLPNAPAPGSELCDLQELEPDAVKEFRFESEVPDEAAFSLIVFLHDAAVHGYVNQCPHHWLPMNRRDGKFLRWSSTEIMCSHHSAVFDLSRSGHCSMGPCLGTNLVQVPLQVENGRVAIAS